MSFTPRLNDSGMNTSGTYYRYIYGTTYPNIPLPNCTFYAYSRTMEIAIVNYGGDWNLITHDTNPYWWRGSSTYGMAETWYNDAIGRGIWQHGSTPQLGAIACWGGDQLGLGGHVAVVEEINADGTVNLSNSSYGGQYFFMEYNQRLIVGETTPYTGEKFLGYLYNPLSSGDIPTPKYIPFRRGDWVKIIKYGNAQANGKGRRAYGLGWKRQVIRVYPGKKYPYRVGWLKNGETTGFYREDALRKL